MSDPYPLKVLAYVKMLQYIDKEERQRIPKSIQIYLYEDIVYGLCKDIIHDMYKIMYRKKGASKREIKTRVDILIDILE